MAETAKHLPAKQVPPSAQGVLVQALRSPMAMHAHLSKLEYVLAQAMAKAFADMGYKAADRADEIVYLVERMPAEVLQHLPCIRLDEIPIGINKGILRAFGDFYGLNVATFMHFLTRHYQSELRADAVKKLKDAEVPTPAPSARQMARLRLQRIVSAFATYRATGQYNDYGSLVFDAINTMGKIPFSTEKEQLILQRAKQNLLNRYSRPSPFADERIKLRSQLNQLLEGQSENQVVTEAKRIALFELFDYLIGMDMGVEEFLEER